MAGFIKMAVGGGGKGNKAPTIRNFRQEGKIESTYFDVKYIAEDFENTILRHYVYIDGRKQEITKNVGYEQPSNEFTYRVDNLNLNTKYQIQIEVTDGIDTVRSDTISVATANYQIFGVRVMENNSNPNTCCTYIEDAIGISPATPTSLGGWVNKWPFNKIRIVGFKGGKVTKEINPNNKTQYKDGSTVPTDVDVMVEIPKVYWKFTNISNGYELRIANTKIDSSWDCYAHKVEEIEKDYIYIGAYLGRIEYGKLRSKSGVSPNVSISFENFMNLAKANGEGYQLWNWYTLLALQILYLISYKNLDSQIALGLGLTNASKIFETGGTNTKGMIFGEESGYQQMCFLGIEDLWGNLYQFVDGIYYNGSSISVTPNNKLFNDNSSHYINCGSMSASNGYINRVSHNNKSGFFPVEMRGSSSTYYSDEGRIFAGKYGASSSTYNKHNSSGIFSLKMEFLLTDSGSGIGSRLCYLG